MSSDRTFTIHTVTTVNGCVTKKPKSTRYHSSSAIGAAKKAHTVLCARKRTKGTCTFLITMRETTQGSNKKLYTYKVSRHLLDEPVELNSGVTFEYEVVAKKARTKKKSKKCRRQSPGKIRSRKSRKSRKYGMWPFGKSPAADDLEQAKDSADRRAVAAAAAKAAKAAKLSSVQQMQDKKAKKAGAGAEAFAARSTFFRSTPQQHGYSVESSAKSIISAVDAGLARRSIKRIPSSVSKRTADKFMKSWRKSSRKSRKSKRKSKRKPKSRKSKCRSCHKKKSCGKSKKYKNCSWRKGVGCVKKSRKYSASMDHP